METKLTSVVEFIVAAEVPHRLLTEATEAGLDAARTRAGPGVDASGSLGSISARAGTRSVRIALTLRATAAGALAAEAAFAEAFLGRVRAQGFDGRRE